VAKGRQPLPLCQLQGLLHQEARSVVGIGLHAAVVIE
jgi:hypothetical protein